MKAILKKLLTIFLVFKCTKPKSSVVNNEPMDKCDIVYIPDSLRRKNRDCINIFEVGEQLYYRCDKEDLENPYKKISPIELSHNRMGLRGNILSKPEDVLWNIVPAKHSFEKFDKHICTLQIKDLNSNNGFKKTYTQNKDGKDHIGELELLHEPEECMYPHSVFRVKINDEVITFANYDTLRKLKEIKGKIQQELYKIILREEVSQANNPIT